MVVGEKGDTGEPGPPGTVYAGGPSPYILGPVAIDVSGVRIYEVGPITVSDSKKVLLLANVVYTSTENPVRIVLGRATETGAAATASINLVGGYVDNGSGVISEGCLSGNPGNATAISMNLSGHAIDIPADGTYYYSLWMASGAEATYGLGISLSVLLIG